MRKTNQLKKSNLLNNTTPNIKNNFTKIPNEIITINKNVLNDFAKIVYFYLLSLDAKNTYLSYGLLEKALGRSKDRVRIAIDELKKNNLLKTEKVGINKYKYELVNFREEKEEEQQESQADTDADAGTKKEDKKTDAEEQEIIEDLEELTEDEKKINRYNELYNEYCAECTSIAKANKSKIIYIIDTYSEEDIIKTLIYFNDFIKANKGKYKENYKYLVTNFNEVNKMKDSYNKAPKNNKFYNFKGRNYTKEDFKKLEKSFFNNNSDVGADAEQEQEEQQEKNKVKYIAIGTSKEIAETYIKDRGLAEYKNNILNDIYKIHNPSNAKEYKRALETECKKYNNIMMQKI